MPGPDYLQFKSYIESQRLDLYHHGILGQKWGVKNGPPYPIDKSNKINFDVNIIDKPLIKKGEKVELHQLPNSSFAKIMSKIFPSTKRTMDDYKDYSIKDNDGKNIGNMTIDKVSKDEINIVWLFIKQEGVGYGTSAMRNIISQVKEDGYKYISLEVPTISPNAKHIYEKLGFKESGEKLGSEDDVWGGLTKMKLKLR